MQNPPFQFSLASRRLFAGLGVPLISLTWQLQKLHKSNKENYRVAEREMSAIIGFQFAKKDNATQRTLGLYTWQLDVAKHRRLKTTDKR